MEIGVHDYCPSCKAIKKTDFCHNCGYLEKRDDLDGSPKTEVKSIFEQMVGSNVDLITNKPQDNRVSSRKKLKFLIPIFLFLLFATTAALGAYYFFYMGRSYMTPVKDDLKKPSLNSALNTEDLNLVQIVGDERSIDLEMDLKEGNFETVAYANFAGADINVLAELFDFRHFLKNILGHDQMLEEIKKDFDISDDDFDVYFDKEFAFLFPDNNFDRWGIVLKYKDEQFVNDSVATFNKYKENPKNKYAAYTIITASMDDSKFLIISNSKVFSDQMKEFSEGNIQNLKSDAIYSKSITDLPKLGIASIYKKPGSTSWDYISDWAGARYDNYVGINQVLDSMQSRAITIQSKEGKTRFVTSIDE